MESVVQFVKKNRILVGVVAVLLIAVLVVWLIVASVQRSTDRQGYALQRDVLTAQHDMEISLSTCLDKTNVASQVTQQQYEAIKEILTSAVSARYVDANGNGTRADAALGGGQFVSALSEQYPQIDTSTWTHLLNVAVGCRTDFAGAQDQLQTLAGNFEKWTHGGSIFTDSIRRQWPNNELKAYDSVHNTWLYGKDALDWYTQPILTSDTQHAVDTHTMPSQTLQPSPSH